MPKRIRQVSFTVTASEYVDLTKRATEMDLNMSNYLRQNLGLLVEVQKPKREEDPYEYRAEKAGHK